MAHHVQSFNAGQVCNAGSRIFVHEKVYDRFLKQFTAWAQDVQVGEPFSQDTFQGPLVSQVQYDVCPIFMQLASAAR